MKVFGKIARGLLGGLSWEVQDKIYFLRKFGRFPRVDAPVTLNDHVMARKWGDCRTDPIYPLLADKLAVRGFVEEKIGSCWLIPLIAVAYDARTLAGQLRNLSSVVVKPNHGAGMVEIVDGDLTAARVTEVVESAEEWLQTDFSQVGREYHYKMIKPCVLVEKRIGLPGSVPIDYKVHFFNIKSGFKFVLQVIHERRETKLTRTFYVNQLTVRETGDYVLSDVERRHIEKALALSSTLVGDLTYARVDWYIEDGQLYFGEMTLTPAAGFGEGYGKSLDELMGSMWNEAEGRAC